MSSPGEGDDEDGGQSDSSDSEAEQPSPPRESSTGDGESRDRTGQSPSPDGPPPADGREPRGEKSEPNREEWRSPDSESGPTQRHDGPDHSETKLFLYDLASSILAVVLVGMYLFAVSGVWPPLVAVESGSMVPNMQVNDLVFVMEQHRFPGHNAQPGTGVVTAHAAERYRKFGNPGDVIVYEKNGDKDATPIIHRAMFWVEKGEDWCAMANPDYLGGLSPGDRRCIADHAGFVTKGDHNHRYDQANGLSSPVKPSWVIGTAEFRIPGLGWIRLATQ